jgi:hypothetical protein
VYSLLEREKDPVRRLGLCEKASHLMQERLIELSSDAGVPSATTETERLEIEEALRKVWKIEQRARSSQS